VVGSRRPTMVAHEECRHPIAAPRNRTASFQMLPAAESYHREHLGFTDPTLCSRLRRPKTLFDTIEWILNFEN